MAQRGKSRKTVAKIKAAVKKSVKAAPARKAAKVSARPAAKAAARAKPKMAAKPQATAANLRPWMEDHLRRYLATNGADGHLWMGVPTLLLTTTGRSSGENRMLPLIYGRDGDRYLVVGSRGGAPDHPAWYQNLVANPEVQVQVRGDRFRARARTANPDERPRLWRTMTKIFPAYDQYQSRTSREIPVIILQRH